MTHVNVLTRYASPDMQDLWSRHNLIATSRRFWVAVLEVRRDEETDPAQKAKFDTAIMAYNRVMDVVDTVSIDEREKRLRHDQMAEIEEFNEIAGSRMIHERMTSRDKSDNVEQIIIYRSLQHVKRRTIAVLSGLSELAREYSSMDMCGRTHNTPAQVTTLGKRFANIAEELILRYQHLFDFITRYQFRGIKGPTGTKQDLKISDSNVFSKMGISPAVMDSVGQVYPRTIDMETVEVLLGLAAAMSNFALLIRLMAGQDFLHEGFGADQVGSSAMPHKINARTSERINGLYGVLKGHHTMIEHVAGNQWFEGDVSCSVVRRVVFPDAFFAIDGMMECILTVMQEMEVFPHMISMELARYMPFLSTTAMLSAAIDKGMDRQTAHALIKKYAVAAVNDIREGNSPIVGGDPLLVHYLAADADFPLSSEEMRQLMLVPNHGEAEEQVERVCERIDGIILDDPQAALYEPHPIR